MILSSYSKYHQSVWHLMLTVSAVGMTQLKILYINVLLGIIRLIMVCFLLVILQHTGLLKILGGRSGVLMVLLTSVETEPIIKIVSSILGLLPFKWIVQFPIVTNVLAPSRIPAPSVKQVTTLVLMAHWTNVNNVSMQIVKLATHVNKMLHCKEDAKFVKQDTLYKHQHNHVKLLKKSRLIIVLCILKIIILA